MFENLLYETWLTILDKPFMFALFLDESDYLFFEDYWTLLWEMIFSGSKFILKCFIKFFCYNIIVWWFYLGHTIWVKKPVSKQCSFLIISLLACLVKFGILNLFKMWPLTCWYMLLSFLNTFLMDCCI